MQLIVQLFAHRPCPPALQNILFKMIGAISHERHAWLRLAEDTKQLELRAKQVAADRLSIEQQLNFFAERRLQETF